MEIMTILQGMILMSAGFALGVFVKTWRATKAANRYERKLKMSREIDEILGETRWGFPSWGKGKR